jgi:hypothetical protein
MVRLLVVLLGLVRLLLLLLLLVLIYLDGEHYPSGLADTGSELGGGIVVKLGGRRRGICYERRERARGGATLGGAAGAHVGGLEGKLERVRGRVGVIEGAGLNADCWVKGHVHETEVHVKIHLWVVYWWPHAGKGVPVWRSACRVRVCVCCVMLGCVVEEEVEWVTWVEPEILGHECRGRRVGSHTFVERGWNQTTRVIIGGCAIALILISAADWHCFIRLFVFPALLGLLSVIHVKPSIERRFATPCVSGEVT